MKKLFIVLMGTSLIATGGMISAGASFAQSAPEGTNAAPSDPAAQPPAQTLFQEQPAAEAPAQAEPPSLSDYLNQAGGGAKSSQEDNQAANDVEGVDPNAPGLNLEGASAPAQAEPVEKPVSPEVQKAKAEAQLRKDAFDATTNQLMPLKPSEIRRIMEMYDETTQAAETPIFPTPEPESAFKTISLDPGAKPLTIKTAMGTVTTLSIVDITGQPWPIQDLTWAGDFQIEQPEKGSHMLRITPTSQFATGNISMRVLGLNPPVIFSIKAERSSVHVRLDVQIPEVGPKGILPPVETPITTKAGDDFMTSVLMGVVKGTNVARLSVDGIDGRTSAYVEGDTMYVRTPYTMLSPAWLKSVQSGDGTKVYALNFTPVVLLSDKGKMVRAYFSRKEISDEQ